MAKFNSLSVGTRKFLDKVTREVVVQYNVGFMYLPGSDEMWESVDHPAMFRTEKEAEKFLAKVKANMHKINLANWVFEGHVCSPIQPTNQQGFYSPVSFG